MCASVGVSFSHAHAYDMVICFPVVVWLRLHLCDVLSGLFRCTADWLAVFSFPFRACFFFPSFCDLRFSGLVLFHPPVSLLPAFLCQFLADCFNCFCELELMHVFRLPESFTSVGCVLAEFGAFVPTNVVSKLYFFPQTP